MPSTYAHYRLGKAVQTKVGEQEQQIIQEYSELFFIGLHGPDILFFYQPVYRNSVHRMGVHLHARPGKEFFARAAQVIGHNGTQKAYLSYIYGVLCHFALDVSCHGYIREKVKSSGITHAEIESEFDRELLVMDGYDPIRQRLTNHIVPSRQNAQIISAFYPPLTTGQVYKSLKDMIFCHNVLLAPSKYKRWAIDTLLRMVGHYKNVHGMMINYTKNPACDDSTQHLMELYEQGENLAIQLIGQFDLYLKGKGNLAPICQYNFGSQLPENND